MKAGIIMANYDVVNRRITVSAAGYGTAIVNLYYVSTTADSIRLLNLTGTPCPEGRKISDTGLNGMNASFFCSLGYEGIDWNCINNVAYQGGAVCSMQNTRYQVSNGKWYYVKAGSRNIPGAGMGLIYYNGTSSLGYSSDVVVPPSSVISTNSQAWAQGGIALFLGDSNWSEKFVQQYEKNLGPDMGSDNFIKTWDYRTALAAKAGSKEIYLFYANGNTYVAHFRAAIMETLGITEGTASTTPWGAIMLDGGSKAQFVVNGHNYSNRLGIKEVPQMIVLK